MVTLYGPYCIYFLFRRSLRSKGNVQNGFDNFWEFCTQLLWIHQSMSVERAANSTGKNLWRLQGHHQEERVTLQIKPFFFFCIILQSIRYSSLLEKTLLVMENLFFECQISHKFDLKGSDRNRLVDTTNLNGEIVLLDENLIQSSFKRKSIRNDHI